MRVYPAIILNEPYIEYVRIGKKTIETRMRLLTRLVGDIVFCCDKEKSKGSHNAGNAVCLVAVEPGKLMTKEDESGACIEQVEGRYAYPLSNLRHFSYNFNVKDYVVKRCCNYQGIFEIYIPDFVEIIPFT